MYQLGEVEHDEELEEFARLHNFTIGKFEGTDEEILSKSLDSWQNVEAIFVNKTKKMLDSGVITDTSDLALTRAIDNWQKNRGIWNKINDKEEKLEDR